MPSPHSAAARSPTSCSSNATRALAWWRAPRGCPSSRPRCFGLHHVAGSGAGCVVRSFGVHGNCPVGHSSGLRTGSRTGGAGEAVGAMTEAGYIGPETRRATEARATRAGVLYGPLADAAPGARRRPMWLTPAQAMCSRGQRRGRWGAEAGTVHAGPAGPAHCAASPPPWRTCRPPCPWAAWACAPSPRWPADRLMAVVPGASWTTSWTAERDRGCQPGYGRALPGPEGGHPLSARA